MSFAKPLAKLEPTAYAVLRIVIGFLFLWHGTQKLFGFPAALPPGVTLPLQLKIGGVIELVCGALIMIGLFTRYAAFLASGTMAVAYFQFHWKLQFAHKMFFPLVNMGEEAVVYCFVFLFIACRGAGAWSVDRKLGE
jgi:putative oxidoreductase